MANINYRQGWDALGDHVESCLKPLSYSEFWLDNPRTMDMRDSQRSFYSPDKLTEITLMNHEGIGDFPGQGDYVVSITLWTTPNPMLKYAGQTSSKGVKTFLEPIK